MAYRCGNCSRVSFDIDTPNCTDSCVGFEPEHVELIHLRFENTRPVKVYCLKDVPNGSVRFSSTIHGTTCPSCRKVFFDDKRSEYEKQKAIPKKEKTYGTEKQNDSISETILSSPGNDEEPEGLSDSPDEDIIDPTDLASDDQE